MCWFLWWSVYAGNTESTHEVYIPLNLPKLGLLMSDKFSDAGKEKINSQMAVKPVSCSLNIALINMKYTVQGN